MASFAIKNNSWIRKELKINNCLAFACRYMSRSVSDLHCVAVVHVAICDPPLSLTIFLGAESVCFGACILRSGVYLSLVQLKVSKLLM